jgi:hypothetical protein
LEGDNYGEVPVTGHHIYQTKRGSLTYWIYRSRREKKSKTYYFHTREEAEAKEASDLAENGPIRRRIRGPKQDFRSLGKSGHLHIRTKGTRWEISFLGDDGRQHTRGAATLEEALVVRSKMYAQQGWEEA